ncbi:MAG: hypothetical protein RR620_13630 [Clostridium sp.]
MTNKVISKYLILFLAVIAIIIGYIKPVENVYNTTVRFYTVEDNNISYSVNKGSLKTLNKFNDTFIEETSENGTHINVQPVTGLANEYLISIKSKEQISENLVTDIINTYKQGLIDNVDNIYHVSSLEYKDMSFSYSKINNVIWMLVRAILVGLSILFAKNTLKKYQKRKEKDFEGIILLVVGAVALYFNLTLVLIPVLITFSLIYRYCKKSDNFKDFRNIAILGIVIRVLVAIAILGLTYLKFGTLFSYLQPDEIFYYSSGELMSNIFQSFSIPDFKAIVGLEQYGYNVFIGIIKLINGSGSFFIVKLINVCISLVFIFVVYDFTFEILENKRVAKLAAIIMAIMPTFPLFSAFALRDVIISFAMLIVIYQIVKLNSGKCDNYVKSIAYFIVACIILWYFRRFALLILMGMSILYTILKFTTRRNINIWIAVVVIGILGIVVLNLASDLYSFSIFNMVLNYINNTGIIEVTKGVILSMLNLDFLTSGVDNIYSTLKSSGIRLMYPDTLMLILTFPLFIVGLVQAFKKNKEFVISILVFIFGLILIYRIEYGGWFLRIQLQILPYQYMIIAAGIYKVFKNSKILKRL